MRPQHGCSTQSRGSIPKFLEEATVPTTNVPVRDTPPRPNEAFPRPLALKNKQVHNKPAEKGSGTDTSRGGTRDASQSEKPTPIRPLEASAQRRGGRRPARGSPQRLTLRAREGRFGTTGQRDLPGEGGLAEQRPAYPCPAPVPTLPSSGAGDRLVHPAHAGGEVGVAP